MFAQTEVGGVEKYELTINWLKVKSFNHLAIAPLLRKLVILWFNKVTALLNKQTDKNKTSYLS